RPRRRQRRSRPRRGPAVKARSCRPAAGARSWDAASRIRTPTAACSPGCCGFAAGTHLAVVERRMSPASRFRLIVATLLLLVLPCGCRDGAADPKDGAAVVADTGANDAPSDPPEADQ